MNLFESIKSNLNEATNILGGVYFDADEFEQEIPHNMRWKHKEELDDDYIYWVTQEPFTKEDLQKFVDKLKPYHKGAYVTVRDLSSYDVDSDHDEGVLVHVDKDGKITHFDDYWEQASHWFNEADEPTIKLSDTYKVIDVPKGHITATPSIAREINRKPLDKEKYGILMKAVDDIITDIGSDEEQLKDLRDDVYSEFNRALGLKESEKLNEAFTKEMFKSEYPNTPVPTFADLKVIIDHLDYLSNMYKSDGFPMSDKFDKYVAGLASLLDPILRFYDPENWGSFEDSSVDDKE